MFGNSHFLYAIPHFGMVLFCCDHQRGNLLDNQRFKQEKCWLNLVVQEAEEFSKCCFLGVNFIVVTIIMNSGCRKLFFLLLKNE